MLDGKATNLCVLPFSSFKKSLTDVDHVYFALRGVDFFPKGGCRPSFRKVFYIRYTKAIKEFELIGGQLSSEVPWQIVYIKSIRDGDHVPRFAVAWRLFTHNVLCDSVKPHRLTSEDLTRFNPSISVFRLPQWCLSGNQYANAYAVFDPTADSFTTVVERKGLLSKLYGQYVCILCWRLIVF